MEFDCWNTIQASKKIAWCSGNCKEELPKKPVGRLLVNCRPTKKDYKRVGQAFQNQQEQNQELTTLLEEREKEAEELANLVRNKDEVVKNLERRFLNAKKVIAELRAEVRRRDQPAP